MNKAAAQKTGTTFQAGISEYAVVCCDAGDTIVSWDAQAERLFGRRHTEVLGKNFFRLILAARADVAGDGSSRLSDLFRQHRKEISVTIKLNEQVVAADGHRFPAELIISPLPGNEFFTIFVRNLALIKEQHDALIDRAFQFEVVNTVLNMSLEPTLLKDRLQSILSYVISLEQLDLLPMAALFLVEQDAQSLSLNVAVGLGPDQLEHCSRVAFGHCYCGKAAITNKLQFVGGTTGSTAHAPPQQIAHGHYCVPFATHGIVNGVICFFVPEPHRKTSRREELLVAVSELIGKIIDSQKMDLQLINLVNDLRSSIIALREEKQFSDSIIQGLEHGLIITDQDGIIQKANTVAQDILHMFSAELEGQTLEGIIGTEHTRRILSSRKTTTPGEENELVLSANNEEELIVRYSVVERTGNRGEPNGMIISLTDVSEWRSVRKEMEKMNRLSTVAEIASAVAHEVRNPLAGIKIMAQSIEENSCSDEDRVECAQRIIRQVDRLNELLTDFFSYARPVIPKKQPTSLQNILSEIKPLIINKLVKQRISLLEDFEKDLPLVIADPNQIQQVFLNLFLNSIDAIKQEGTIEVGASILAGQKLTRYRKKNHLLTKGARYVLVTFKDNGAGMSQPAAEKVFEPFFTTKSNGSGLGMSIVYRTLKENDAGISVQSAEGKGTTFSMYFKAC